MAIRTGDIVTEVGPYECIECGGRVRLEQGDKTPACPCGGIFYLAMGPCPTRQTAPPLPQHHQPPRGETVPEDHRRLAA